MLTLISAKTGLKTQTNIIPKLYNHVSPNQSFIFDLFSTLKTVGKYHIVKPDPHTKLFIYVQNMLTK